MARLLEGRSAVVVGAGPGLGAAIAAQLADAGAALFLVSRTQAVLDEIAEPLRRAAATITTVVADLDRPEGRDRIRAAVEGGGAALDVLVHNAARHGVQKPFAESDMADWQATMNTNLFAPLALTQTLLPLLRKGKRPSVVFVSAMAMRMVASVGRGGYALSKAAINQAVRNLAYELGGEGIRVNAVVPGWMESAHVQGWREDPKFAPLVDRALANIPLGRIPLPEEVAGSVLYLASDLSSVVTGASIDVNGGHFMGS